MNLFIYLFIFIDCYSLPGNYSEGFGMEKPTARWSQAGGAGSGGLKDSDESDAATSSTTPAAAGATSSNTTAPTKPAVAAKPSEVCFLNNLKILFRNGL